MIIACQCGKKFNIDSSLIPPKGRFLECGSCKRKWYYKFDEANFKKEYKKKETKIKKIDPEEKIPSEIDKIITDAEKISVQKNILIDKTQPNVSLINIFLLFLITFVAFIIILDTFQNPINKLIPGFNYLLENFYESVKDLYFFFRDLIR
tara:strand:+ start:139 stop:588 length:450 start_codon:yes stop_codon:yes gene_type:complete